MSYVWSEPKTITVYSETTPPPPPPQVTITRVVITSVTPQNPKVGEVVTVVAEAYFSAQLPSSKCVEAVLAANSQSNIVSSVKGTFNPGSTGARATFQIRFNQPGTYTLWAGFRFADTTC